MVSRDLVADLDRHFSPDRLGHWLALRSLADVRPAEDLDTRAILRREDEHAVVDGEVVHLWRLDGLDFILGQRIRDDASEGAQRGDLGTDEIDLGTGGTAAPFEVAVVRPQRDCVAARTLVVADAEAACRLQDARSCPHQALERAVLAHHEEDLSAAGSDAEGDEGGHLTSLEQTADLVDVGV